MLDSGCPNEDVKVAFVAILNFIDFTHDGKYLR